MKPLSGYMGEALKKLGSGEEGTVYDIGDGRIKKVFKRGNVPLAYQLLKAATDYGVIQCLPKVYEIGDDYIIRENCKPNTPKCKEYYKISQTAIYNDRDKLYWEVLNGNYWYDPDKNNYFSNIKGIIRGNNRKLCNGYVDSNMNSHRYVVNVPVWETLV